MRCTLIFLPLWIILFSSFYEFRAEAYVDEVDPSHEQFLSYKPLFFLVGADRSKFQFSFKTKIVQSLPLYFAYTQTSFWDIFKNSSPFLDTSYSPDLFFRTVLDVDQKTWLDFGIVHESNGRDGVNSRGWNRLYIRFSTNHSIKQSRLNWSLQAWVPFTSEDPNTLLPRYRGVYEGIVTWSDCFGEGFDKDDLTLRIYPGGAFSINPVLGGQEVTLRLKSSERKLLPLFLIQLFHGYAESMLLFQNSTWVGRAGIGF